MSMKVRGEEYPYILGTVFTYVGKAEVDDNSRCVKNTQFIHTIITVVFQDPSRRYY